VSSQSSASGMSNSDVDHLFSSVNTMLSSISNANSAWVYISSSLSNYAVGSSASDQGCLSGLASTLLDSWSGAAASEFKNKTDAVTKFMVDLAANASRQAQPAFSVVLAGASDQLSSIQRQKSDAIDPAHTQWCTQVAQQIVGAMGVSGSVQNEAGYAVADSWAQASGNTPLLTGLQHFAGTVGEIVTGGNMFSLPSKPIVVDNFEDFYNCVCSEHPNVTITWKPDFTLIYSDPSCGDAQTSHDWEPQKVPASFGVWDLQATVTALAGWLTAASTNSYHNVLRNAINQVGQQYIKLVNSLPKPLKNSDIGQPGGETGPTMPGGPGGLGDNPFGTGTLSPDTGLAGLAPGNPNSAGMNPDAFNNPSAFNPGGLGSGSQGGGWDPSSLAGFNPTGVGGGLGSTGFGDGSGLSSGTGLDAGAGVGPGTGAGLGADAATGGLAGAAGRAMPMAPMGGGGAGKDSEGRQRTVYLTEDEDVWGANGEGGSGVL